MEYGPPPLFNQGVPARARLAFFSFLAVALIVIDARVNALDAIRTGVEVMLYPLQRALLWPRDALEQVGGYFTSVGSLTRENEQLRRADVERATLLQQAEQLRAENERLRKMAGVRERAGTGGHVVQALYESRDPFSRKLVVDRGATDGVRAGSPVVDDLGLIGQVTRVFPVTAEVTLLTDREQSVPVQVVRNGLRAVAFGGAEPATLELRFLPANADVGNGDLVVTSGLDGIYPPGLPVGRVARVERDVKDQFARIVMDPVAGVGANRLLVVLSVDSSALPPPPREESRGDARASARKGARK
jgi:rod shape-determining protein MreC